MKTTNTYLAAFAMLLFSIFFVSVKATACPFDIQPNDGSWSFTAAPGGVFVKTVTLSSASFDEGASISCGSGPFSVDQTSLTVPARGTATFSVTFIPGESAPGTVHGVLTVRISGSCTKTFTFDLTGTVAQSGVANVLPGNVSITITPNPAKDVVTIVTGGILGTSAEIEIYDVLGKEIASAKSASWKWDASRIAPGSYIVRVAGVSMSGEAIVSSRKIIIRR